jgi:hypothetical protein
MLHAWVMDEASDVPAGSEPTARSDGINIGIVPL